MAALNDRKISILKAIINDYIATAEPVGSRTIAKRYDLGVSSATIRNEMSDLEEMGLIIQPHASAGRIPSDLGYRLYVDHLMGVQSLSREQEDFIRAVVSRNISRIDSLMEETARALSALTSYTTIITEPAMKTTALKQIRLLPLDEASIMLVIATEGNFVKTHIIRTGPIPDEDVHSVSERINNVLRGHTLEDIDENTIILLQRELKEYSGLYKPVIKAVQRTIRSAENVQLHMSGTKNILTFPEFSDISRAKGLFQTLEQKDVIKGILDDSLGKELSVLIGNEINVEEMQDCSIISTTYRMGGNTLGSIGVLGPTRMDYNKVISVLNEMVRNIEGVIKNIGDDGET